MLKFEPFYQEYERTLDAFSLAFSTIYFEQMTIAPKMITNRTTTPIVAKILDNSLIIVSSVFTFIHRLQYGNY